MSSGRHSARHRQAARPRAPRQRMNRAPRWYGCAAPKRRRLHRWPVPPAAILTTPSGRSHRRVWRPISRRRAVAVRPARAGSRPHRSSRRPRGRIRDRPPHRARSRGSRHAPGAGPCRRCRQAAPRRWRRSEFFTAGMATSVSAIPAGTGVDHGSHASGSARAESAMSMAMRAAACCSSGRGASKGLGRAGPMHSMQAAHSAIGPQCESSYHCAAREARANSKLEKKSAHMSVGAFEKNVMNFGGADGARTRDPRRDRPVF